MSVTRHSARNDEEETTETTESVELGRSMLGLIGAYAMGAALEVSDLYPTHSASALESESVPATT